MARARAGGFLEKAGLKRIVVGHAPTKELRITTRYDGRVIVIDTGMLTQVYNRRPSALERRGAQMNAISEDGTVRLSGASTPAMASSR